MLKESEMHPVEHHSRHHVLSKGPNVKNGDLLVKPCIAILAESQDVQRICSQTDMMKSLDRSTHLPTGLSDDSINHRTDEEVVIEHIDSAYAHGAEDIIRDGVKIGTYCGQYRNGCKCGKGVYVFYPSGDKYTGTFDNNYFEGFGILSCVDGRIYAGNFQKSKYAGWGKLFFPNGKIYEGNFVNDQRDGWGKLTGMDSDTKGYEGYWKAGKPHGVGIQSDVFTTQSASQWSVLTDTDADATSPSSYYGSLGRSSSPVTTPTGNHRQSLLGFNLLTNFHHHSTLMYRIGEWENGKRVRWISEPVSDLNMLLSMGKERDMLPGTWTEDSQRPTSLPKEFDQIKLGGVRFENGEVNH